MDNFEYSEFDLEKVLHLKGDRSIYVIFSTFGEREAQLIYKKIKLLNKELGPLINKILVSHRRKTSAPEKTEQRAMDADENIDLLICNKYKVPDMKSEKGKGADMRRALYHIIKTYNPSKDDVVVYLDTDVLTKYFGSHFVLALAGTVLKGYDFSKASFWREMGRVKKYVAQPLFSSIKHDKIKDLKKMHYPLSGEVAGTIDFFTSVHYWQMYGIETGINIEACYNDYKIADVNLGLYDHEHNTVFNIQKMCFGIIKTYLTQLRDYGLIEFKDGAEIADEFEASYIDRHKKRKAFKNKLKEIKYKPLKEII